ncbi:MAG: type II toxin-antitoxin system VapC family toxin [Myxococcales bacterium]|nr:type II toxin-antitoxin system VapC family toxin [Myxococcales bacterium]
MAVLFDTDAISELWRPRPAPAYLEWIAALHLDDQCTSAVVVGELFKGAYRSARREKYLALIERRLLPRMRVFPYDTTVARQYGRCRADLEQKGTPVAEADLQIAATALVHGLELVTGNIRHFEKVPGLRINRALADARQAG